MWHDLVSGCVVLYDLAQGGVLQCVGGTYKSSKFPCPHTRHGSMKFWVSLIYLFFFWLLLLLSSAFVCSAQVDRFSLAIPFQQLLFLDSASIIFFNIPHVESLVSSPRSVHVLPCMMKHFIISLYVLLAALGFL